MPRDDNTEVVGLRADFRDMTRTFGDMRESFGKMQGSVEGLASALENHAQYCPAVIALANAGKGKGAGASIMPGANKRLSGLGIAKTFGPIILAAMLGLLGLGAYLGGGNDEDLAKSVRELGPIVKQLQAEISALEAEGDEAEK